SNAIETERSLVCAGACRPVPFGPDDSASRLPWFCVHHFLSRTAHTQLQLNQRLARRQQSDAASRIRNAPKVTALPHQLSHQHEDSGWAALARPRPVPASVRSLAKSFPEPANKVSRPVPPQSRNALARLSVKARGVPYPNLSKRTRLRAGHSHRGYIAARQDRREYRLSARHRYRGANP